jgi:hypothetical protein
VPQRWQVSALAGRHPVGRPNSPGEPAGVQGLAHGRQVIERPAQLAGTVVRRQKQPRPAMHLVAMRLQRVDPRVHAPVLPAEDRRQRHSADAIPAHRTGALARQPGGHELGRARPEGIGRLRHRGVHRRDDLLGVLLGPVGLRASQRDFPFTVAEDPAARVEHQRPARVRALVDGEEKRRGRLARHVQRFCWRKTRKYWCGRKPCSAVSA